jgi:hypothetical protein
MTPCRVAARLRVGDSAAIPFDSSVEKTFARPKSNTFTEPAGVIFTLAGFRSRWTTGTALVRSVYPQAPAECYGTGTSCASSVNQLSTTLSGT